MNNLGSKQSVNEIWPVYVISQRKKISEDSTKTVTWKLVPGPFEFAKNYAQPLLENETFQASYLYHVMHYMY